MNIREFQAMMRQLYFQKDSARGAKGTYNCLVDEVAELGVSLRNADKEALEKEFADVIAWLASLANVTNVDLEAAALEKYDHKCPKCRHAPCECAFQH